MKTKTAPRITAGELIRFLENASSGAEVVIQSTYGTPIEFRIWEQWHDSSESRVRIDLIEVPPESEES